MNRTLRIIAGILVLFSFTAGCTKAKDEAGQGGAIKIGAVGPLTGEVAYIGENMKAALELARDEINGAGGIKGKKIEIIFEDGKCDPKEAANAGNKLVNIDKVAAIIGGFCSSETLAMAPLAEKAKVVLISAGSTNPRITEAGDFIFRNVPSDAFQGVYAAQYVKTKLNKKRVALLKCLSDWCVGVNDSFKAEFLRLGGEIASEEAFPQDSRDLRSQIVKLKAVNPELIYFVSYTEGTIVGLRQMREIGIKSPVFGADAWSDPKIWESVKGDGEGAMYLEPANKDYPQGFVDAMNKKTGGKVINVYAPRAYDALKILASVMENAGTETESIKKGIYGVSDYKGIADNYTFDGNGDIKNASYSVREFRGGTISAAK
ncbi:MAG: ABC transporter substrate-binding protein [Deltaproteobacteria bacterium]|nr:ABC transporter substrate-binding protein [Deltaproteobacteria bacterium]